MADWDRNSDKLRENLIRAAREARDSARRREEPSARLVRRWHLEMMQGLVVANAGSIGRFRGESGLELVEVEVAGLPGVEPGSVAKELAAYFDKLSAALSILDERNGSASVPTAEQLRMIVRVAGWAHAEWIRIHPFVNGNGRTARLWANWILMRYNIPPFVRLRPRPGGSDYEEAGAAAMRGEWKATVAVFERWLP